MAKERIENGFSLFEKLIEIWVHVQSCVWYLFFYPSFISIAKPTRLLFASVSIWLVVFS